MNMQLWTRQLDCAVGSIVDAVHLSGEQGVDPGRVVGEVDHLLRALFRVETLGGDAGQRDPLLQPLDGLAVALGDLIVDGLEIRARGEKDGQQE